MATKSSAGTMLNEGRLTELKQRLLFLALAILVFRLGAHITIPGIDPEHLKAMFKEMSENGSNGIIDMFDMFGGGALKQLSIFALGIMPYISASIIIQMGTKVYAPLEELSKEGEAGKRKITQYTRYGTVLLGTLQSIFICSGLYSKGVSNFAEGYQLQFIFIGTVTLVTGTLFLMWLGEQVTERGIGNGISMIIFAGIVSGLPSAIGTVFTMGAFSVLFLIVMSVAVIAAIVFIERGQRRITVNYARGQKGQKQTSHLPFKLNMAGVIPPIFASAIVMFPTTIAGFAAKSESMSWMKDYTRFIAPGSPLYLIIFASGIIFFCFFYTALVFNSNETADNLKKSGAFIPGIRPGKQTAAYIDGILTRLTMAGAIYITLVCLLPEFIRGAFEVDFYFGGTSLLIIVVVVMDFMAQVQAHLMSHHYDKVLDKANLKNHGKAGVVKRK